VTQGEESQAAHNLLPALTSVHLWGFTGRLNPGEKVGPRGYFQFSIDWQGCSRGVVGEEENAIRSRDSESSRMQLEARAAGFSAQTPKAPSSASKASSAAASSSP